MNFVGSELDVSTGVVTRSPSSPFSETDDHDSLPDAHPPMSPKGGAESLFLTGLETQQISAFHLSDIIQQQYRIDSTTVATEDYVTAVGGRLSPVESSSIDAFFSSSSADPSSSSPFGKDALALSRELSDDSTPHEEHFHDANMSSSSSSSSKTDAAEKVYDTAKSVWSWGKTVTILSPFLGIAEGVATKVASMAGTSLDSVDGSIQNQLEALDGKYLNPAIAAIVNMLMGTVTKSEEVLKPFIQALLKPVGLIKKDAETPEVTTPSNPALTATPVK